MQVAKSVRNKIQSKYLISFLSACLALNIYIRLTRLCCLFFFCPSFIHNFNFQLAVFLFCYPGPSILFHLLICILLFFPVCSAAYQCQTQGQCQRECCQALDGTNSIMRSSLSVPCVITLFYFILFIVFFWICLVLLIMHVAQGICPLLEMNCGHAVFLENEYTVASVRRKSQR